MGKPHAVAVPYPAQGHVIPLLELAQRLAKHGFKITFVNTDFTHERVMNALSDEDNVSDHIDLVSIPDGLEPWEDRNDLGKLTEAIFRVMPKKLEELIKNINESDDNDVTCVIADESMGWAFDVAKKLQIDRVAFWPAATAMLALIFNIPRMIDDGIIDDRGKPVGDKMIRMKPAMPAINMKNLAWLCLGDEKTGELMFQFMVENNKTVQLADWLICNSSYELEPAAFSLIPNMLPIGPLLASNRLGNSIGNLWPKDLTCLEWLDQQPPNSVIYIAFGSFTMFDNTQFKELALGLALTNRPFLWVVRPEITKDMDNAYPEGFKERVATRGKLVGWAPQQAVLRHPSVACFLSHCGWNSIVEGVSNGLPFLCWPYFADQFLNQSYNCDIWKIGLGFDRDERGIISQEEIKCKVENLLTERSYKERALSLKAMAINSVKEGGSSHENLKKFIEWMKK